MTLELTLYVGRDCHLCETARVVLERLEEELDFEVHEIDITDDQELERRYRQWLPVVEAGGDRISVYRIDEAAIRRLVPPSG